MDKAIEYMSNFYCTDIFLGEAEGYFYTKSCEYVRIVVTEVIPCEEPFLPNQVGKMYTLKEKIM